MNDTTAHKARLEEEKKTLETELSTIGRRNPSNPNDWEAVPAAPQQEADPLDRASHMDNYQENNAILTDLELRYADVNAALERIENGTYGTCETGGEEIESERLDADPAARTCKAHLNS